MSKSAIAGLARGLSQDFASRQITVNTVQPGPIDTDMNPAGGPASAAASSLIPLDRYGEPHEVAALVAFLAGQESAFITGASLTIDGRTARGRLRELAAAVIDRSDEARRRPPLPG